MLQIAMTFISYLGIEYLCGHQCVHRAVALTLMNLAVLALILGFIGAG